MYSSVEMTFFMLLLVVLWSILLGIVHPIITLCHTNFSSSPLLLLSFSPLPFSELIGFSLVGEKGVGMAILTSIIGTLIFFFLANLLLYPFSSSFSCLLSSSCPPPSFLFLLGIFSLTCLCHGIALCFGGGQHSPDRVQLFVQLCFLSLLFELPLDVSSPTSPFHLNLPYTLLSRSFTSSLKLLSDSWPAHFYSVHWWSDSPCSFYLQNCSVSFMIYVLCGASSLFMHVV